jgi:hypothetical protein
MGSSNSSVTRVWPVFTELFCHGGDSKESLRIIFDLAFSKSKKKLAKVLRDSVDPVAKDSLDKPDVTRKIYDLSLRLPRCFEYGAPAPERFLFWLIEHAGQECKPRKSLPESQRIAGLRSDLFGPDGPSQHAAREDAIQQLLINGSERSRRQWWALEGETSVDCFVETPSMILLIEGKRTDAISSGTDWFDKRNQISRNLEIAQAQARGRRYAVLLAAEHETAVSLTDIADGLPHMSSSEQAFLAEHYLGCVTWKELCDAADLQIKLSELIDVASAEQWILAKGFGD